MLVGIWVTTGCNLRCKYCYEGADKTYDNMPIEVADKTVEFIKKVYNKEDQRPLVIEFHGGEPLLNYPIIQYLVARIERELPKHLLGVTTNGTLLTKERISYLSEKMTYGFSLSIDGKRETNDRNRVDYNGTGTYHKIIEIIPELLKAKPDIRARMTYTPETVGKLSENIIYLIKCGFKNIVSAADFFSREWSRKEMEILLQEMEKVRQYHRKNTDELKDVRISILEDRFKTKGYCLGGKENFHILPNGDIYPCSYGVGDEEFLIGNVMNGDLIETQIKKLTEINISPVYECQGCSAYTVCLCTRCKIFNKVLQGDFFQPVPIICAIEHTKQKFWANNSK